MSRQLQGSLGGAAERLFVALVRGRARGPTIHHCPDGNHQTLLGHILVDGVVGEARQRIRLRLDGHFCLVRLAQCQHALGDASQLRLRGQ